MTDTFIIHSDEIFLKGGDRGAFEPRLLQKCGEYDLRK